MLDRAPRFRLVTQATPAVDRLIVGRRAEEAAAILPLIFNICATAQERAARLAFGLPPKAGEPATEIIRDHLLALLIRVPDRLGLAPRVMVAPGDAAAVSRALFGAAGAPPETAEDLSQFLASGQGIAPVSRELLDRFPAGMAVVPGLDLPAGGNVFEHAAIENSPAGRRAAQPLLKLVEGLHGRGPLWRLLGRAVDAWCAAGSDLPAGVAPEPGCAIVPAARGAYAIRARVEDGRVTAFARVTPTDHLLAPGGVLPRFADQIADRQRLELLVELVDPCVGVAIEEVGHA